MKETLDKRDQKEGEMQESPCNLIASKKGRIASILVRSGSAKVKKGDKVKPGMCLFQGL